MPCESRPEKCLKAMRSDVVGDAAREGGQARHQVLRHHPLDGPRRRHGSLLLEDGDRQPHNGGDEAVAQQRPLALAQVDRAELRGEMGLVRQDGV
eukprot:scaffold60254_cov59-Phaeocystis_antarctica.AAC.1